MCAHIRIYVHMLIDTCVHTYIDIHPRKCVYMHLRYTYTYTNLNACTRINMYANVYTYAHVHISRCTLKYFYKYKHIGACTCVPIYRFTDIRTYTI